MRRPLLTEKQIQSAFDLLNESGDEIGTARAMVIRLGYKVKAVQARLTRMAPESSLEAKKAWATAHAEYAEVCEQHAEAEGRWEKLKDQRNKAELILECWRTLSANDRGVVRRVS